MTQTPSAPEALEEAAPDAAADHGDEHEHPSDRQYVKIALILGALTALDSPTSSRCTWRRAIYVVLIVLMILKFIYVVAWFMHLKFDSVLFRRVFVAGIVLALGVYLVMLTAFRIWGV